MTDKSSTGTDAGRQHSTDITSGGIKSLAMGFWASKVLLSAVELGVFSELAKQPLPLDVLQGRIGIHPRGSRDFLDALVGLGMLTREHGIYANTPETDAFLDPAKPGYIGGLLEHYNSRVYPLWGELTDMLRRGGRADDQAEAADFFTMIYRDPALLRGFMRAMSAWSNEAADAIAEKFPWARYSSFVDIGCAEGALAVKVAARYPGLSGGGFDMPPVAPLFDDYVRAAGLGDRVRFYPGDFFVDPLPTADVLILGHVLHDWGISEKQALISKAYEALPPGGALIINDVVIDDERRENVAGMLISLHMLVETKGGFDYTAAECRDWLEQAGFSQSYVEPLVGPESMIVAVKQ
ncbi:methyltransferase [Nocardia colli]|uniref:Methyltransferase n=2 Tax=Nocardia colli TaxID=2545717 RepID=A0A5N0ECI8_9NOCA|nr:methyltransferase [Nocardia colli]